MKTSSVFWGVFFVVAGSFFLILQFDLFSIDFEFSKYLWPLVIIFIGISMFNIPKSVKYALASLSAIVLVLFFFGLFSGCESRSKHIWDNIATNHISETKVMDLHPSIKAATLFLNGAAGDITIKGTTDKLYDLTNNFHKSEQRFEAIDSISNNLYLDLLFSGKNKNNAKSKLKLNTTIDWNINIDAAAFDIEADLRSYKIRNFNSNSAATNFRLRVGELSDTVNINISSAMSNMNIEIPKSFSAKLKGNKVLSNLKIDGFDNSNESGVYFTENFGKTNKVIFIDVQADLSKINFTRVAGGR